MRLETTYVNVRYWYPVCTYIINGRRRLEQKGSLAFVSPSM